MTSRADDAKEINAGIEALKRADYDEAIRLLTRTIETPGQSNDAETNAYVYRGNAYFLKGNYEHAIADYSSAIELKPNDADALRDRAIAYGMNGQYDRAIADYSTVIRLAPTDAEAYYGRGTGYYYKGQYDRAIADFDNAVRLKPDYAEAFSNRGNAYLALGKYDHAASDYSAAIRLSPDDAEAYYNRGMVYVKTKQYDRAIADFDAAIRLRPHYVGAHHYRGALYSLMGKYNLALADFDEVIHQDPNHSKAYFNRGNVYTQLGQDDRAIADYSAAIRLKPEDAEAFYNQGSLHKGEYERAIVDLDAAIHLKTDFAKAYIARGMSRFILGRFREAAADFEQRLLLDASSTYAILWLYIARSKIGDASIDGLKRNAAKVDRSEWPGPVLALYLGEMSAEQVRAAAAQGDAKSQEEQSCQVLFYIGQYELQRKKKAEAKQLLRQAVDACAKDMIERQTRYPNVPEDVLGQDDPANRLLKKSVHGLFQLARRGACPRLAPKIKHLRGRFSCGTSLCRSAGCLSTPG